jgi:enoyl-CoA hydratase/carnithine racemase
MSGGHSGVGKPIQALTAIRRTITEGGVLSFEKGIEIEYEGAVNLAGTKNFSEGIKAFWEKRKPDWD